MRLKPVWILLVALLASGCASTLVQSEKLIRDSIAASEQNHCTVHAAPCLSDEQFKAINAGLYRASVAGSHVTSLEATHAAKPDDYKAFYTEIAATIAAVKATGQGGTIGVILNYLTEAQQKVQDFLTKHGVIS